MAITYFVGRRMSGTAAERTGGTFTDFPAGWEFTETDTNPPLSYLWTGSAWRLITEKDVTETLTGKTLTSPALNTPTVTGSGGTLTLPAGPDTLLGRATTDTLTNKTLTSPAINTPTVTGSGGTLTLPAGPDTLLGRATTDTLTNKTLTSPAINTPTVTGSGGTLTLPAGPDTLVGRATTDTLTNKTLTTPVIATITNTGTLTLPTSTDTLVGKATTDTLTNKTLTSPTINTPVLGTPLTIANGGTGAATLQAASIHVHPPVKKVGAWYGRAITNSSDGTLSANYVVGVVSTGVNTTTIDAAGFYTAMTTGTTVNSLAYHRWSNISCRGLNPIFKLNFALTQVTNTRFFAGFSANSGSNPVSTADPLNGIAGCGLWFDSAVSPNWKIQHNNAGGSNTTDTTTAADTANHTLTITAVDATPSFLVSLDGVLMTNGTITTDPPLQTSNFGPMFWIENTLAATASLMKAYWLTVQQDN